MQPSSPPSDDDDDEAIRAAATHSSDAAKTRRCFVEKKKEVKRVAKRGLPPAANKSKDCGAFFSDKDLVSWSSALHEMPRQSHFPWWC